MLIFKVLDFEIFPSCNQIPRASRGNWNLFQLGGVPTGAVPDRHAHWPQNG